MKPINFSVYDREIISPRVVSPCSVSRDSITVESSEESKQDPKWHQTGFSVAFSGVASESGLGGETPNT